MLYYDIFCLWCATVKKKPATVAQEAGLSKAAPTNWKGRKSPPSKSTQTTIANYFGVTVEQFMKGPPKQENPNTVNREGAYNDYLSLNEKNRAIADQIIRSLLAGQSKE